jgi:hypothetical protein
MSIYLVLSIIDMLAGFLILIRHRFGLWLILFGIFMLIKGAYSFFTAVSSGYWLDWMGAVDMLAGICLMLIYVGFGPAALITIGGIVIAKAAYSLVRSALAMT